METPTQFGIGTTTLTCKATMIETMIETMIGDLNRTILLLERDIDHEEERTGVRDVTDPGYSPLARTLWARHQNLQTTIATLARRPRQIRFEGRATVFREINADIS